MNKKRAAREFCSRDDVGYEEKKHEQVGLIIGI